MKMIFECVILALYFEDIANVLVDEPRHANSDVRCPKHYGCAQDSWRHGISGLSYVLYRGVLTSLESCVMRDMSMLLI